MRRCLLVMTVAVAIWLGFLAMPGLYRSGGGPLAAVSFIAPPPEVGLPVGQRIEVRYRADVTAVLELQVQTHHPPDDIQYPAGMGYVLAVDQVQAGEEIAHCWAPIVEGRHCLVIVVSSAEAPDRSEALATTTRCLTVLPAGSTVRLSIESKAHRNSDTTLRR